MPGNALMRYTIPMPDDSRIPGKDAEEMALNGSVLSTVKNGGPILTIDRTVFELWLGALKVQFGRYAEPLNPLWTVDSTTSQMWPGSPLVHFLSLDAAASVPISS